MNKKQKGLIAVFCLLGIGVLTWIDPNSLEASFMEMYLAWLWYFFKVLAVVAVVLGVVAGCLTLYEWLGD